MGKITETNFVVS